MACGVAWELLRPREPVYQGKRLSQWLDEYNRAGHVDGDWSKMEPISTAIRAMGTNSLPFLLARIKHTEPSLEKKFFEMIAKQRWVKLPLYGEDIYAMPSVMALNVIGSNAAPLCPELLKVAGDPRSCAHGMMALFAIGPAAIPTLSKICQSKVPFLRAQAIITISELNAAILLVDPKRDVAISWAKAPGSGRSLFEFGMVISPEGFQEMIKLLEDTDPTVRRASVEVFSGYGEEAVKPLVKALKDSDETVRNLAAEILKKDHPEAAAKAGVK
jgi:DnaJ-domain-containing protein 1